MMKPTWLPMAFRSKTANFFKPKKQSWKNRVRIGYFIYFFAGAPFYNSLVGYLAVPRLSLNGASFFIAAKRFHISDYNSKNRRLYPHITIAGCTNHKHEYNCTLLSSPQPCTRLLTTWDVIGSRVQGCTSRCLKVRKSKQSGS